MVFPCLCQHIGVMREGGQGDWSLERVSLGDALRSWAVERTVLVAVITWCGCRHIQVVSGLRPPDCHSYETKR